MADLNIFNVEFPNVSGFKIPDTNGDIVTYTESGESSATLGTKSITANGTYNASADNYDGYSSVTVNVPTGSEPSLQAKTNISPTTASQTITPDSGYDGLSSVQINAMPTGTAGTPTATKGTVSNHSISVTPSVTNTTGYITGGTKSGTAVTVSASELVSGTKSISANGTGIDVTTYSTVDVAVPATEPTLQSKTATPTESAQTITADSGYDGLSSVQIDGISSTYVGSGITQRSSTDLTASGATVTVPAGYYSAQASKSVASGTEGTPTATKGTVSNNSVTVTPSVTNSAGYISGGTKNGTAVTVSASELVSGTKSITANGIEDVTNYASVSVDVSPTLQSKSVMPTESSQTITPDASYDGLSSVEVGAISSTYIGSEIAQNDDSDLSASGATVTVPAGYYAENATKSVASGTATTPATTITANPSISVNASGLITATASASQNITPTVSAGYISSGTAGTVSVSGSNTQQLTTKGATTYNTSTSDQTISSGQYLTGTQTIKAVTVSGLDASNIASGVTVKVGDANDDDRIASVTGTLSFVTVYSGSGDPPSSLGNDDSIYLKIVS